MAGVHADIDRLKALRDELKRFIYEQKITRDRAKHELLVTYALLDQAEQRWRLRADQYEASLRNCLEEALYAVALGGYLDCSSWERALSEALERLAEVRLWRGRLEQEEDQYRILEQRLTHQLDFDLLRTLKYLDDRIKALEAFHAAQVIKRD